VRAAFGQGQGRGGFGGESSARLVISRRNFRLLRAVDRPRPHSTRTISCPHGPVPRQEPCRAAPHVEPTLGNGTMRKIIWSGALGTSRKRCLATLTTSVSWDEILRSSVRMMLYCTICETPNSVHGHWPTQSLALNPIRHTHDGENQYMKSNGSALQLSMSLLTSHRRKKIENPCHEC
jgi:hypothetical protein